MLFCRDNENERRAWVDRGVDNRLDNAGICEVCDAITTAKEIPGQEWRDVDTGLCGDCRTEILAQALANDIRSGSRPLNMMAKDRVITNDEMEEQVPSMDAVMRFLFNGDL